MIEDLYLILVQLDPQITIVIHVRAKLTELPSSGLFQFTGRISQASVNDMQNKKIIGGWNEWLKEFDNIRVHLPNSPVTNTLRRYRVEEIQKFTENQIELIIREEWRNTSKLFHNISSVNEIFKL